MNFLDILRCEQTDYVLSEQALGYMADRKLPGNLLSKLQIYRDKVFKNETRWTNFLKRQNIKTERHRQIATEGALIGSIIHHGFNPELAIISDEAGQFNVFLHGLCWVHAERKIQRIIGFNDSQNQLLEEAKTDIWQLYSDLKKYRDNPSEKDKRDLEKRFDSVFARKTGFASLDLALKRLHSNKSELLLVLNRPDIPLHNNLSERDIREYVKRRKVSGSTRSNTGKQCRDTFTSLKKTCRKLNISFWHYLQDRIEHKNTLPPLYLLLKSQLI
jgi:hypothetical protein